MEKASAAQRDRLRSVAAVSVDPGVGSALLAQEAAVQQVLGSTLPIAARIDARTRG